jgi:hypothetical protein
MAIRVPVGWALAGKAAHVRARVRHGSFPAVTDLGYHLAPQAPRGASDIVIHEKKASRR